MAMGTCFISTGTFFCTNELKLVTVSEQCTFSHIYCGVYIDNLSKRFLHTKVPFIVRNFKLFTDDFTHF